MGIGRHASPDPISLSGGPVTVLLVHGFTGSPAEMTLLAEALHRQGYSVEVLEERILKPQNPKFVEAGIGEFKETLIRVYG